MSRIEREKSTFRRMVEVYCRHHHGDAAGKGVCPACAELISYAHGRLDRCRHGADKPSCRRCPVHCYAPRYREAVCRVMRYAGPRMLLIDPVAAIRHLFSEMRR